MPLSHGVTEALDAAPRSGGSGTSAGGTNDLLDPPSSFVCRLARPIGRPALQAGRVERGVFSPLRVLVTLWQTTSADSTME
jgi:hypothetical protein